MILQISIKNVYGRSVAYPENDVAQGFAQIAGTKTLTATVLRTAFDMGCTVDVLDNFGGIAKSFHRAKPGDQTVSS